MGSLKGLRSRIKSIKSTQKITAAMKMVAAAKLRKSQEKVLAIKPYVQKVQSMASHLAAGRDDGDAPILQTGASGAHLIIVMSAEKGLCGGYNSLILKEANALIRKLKADNQAFSLLGIGRKGLEALKRDYPDQILSISGETGPDYALAERITGQIKEWLESGAVGQVHVVGSVFRNALVQDVCVQTLVPFQGPKSKTIPYFLAEPKADVLLPELLEHNLVTRLYSFLLENETCEHAARMTSMDNATRNAQDIVHKLQLVYNQTRQAHITSELIEIISGAQAL